LSAWGGLLDSDPATALKEGVPLFDSLRDSQIQNQKSAIRWLGWKLWRAFDMEIPMPEGSSRSEDRRYARPLREAADWQKHGQCDGLAAEESKDE
jgi:hypothetical protein